jgi:integrase
VKRLDLARGAVEVAESVTDVAGELVFGPTKTYANRHPPVPPVLRDEIAMYFTERAGGRDDLVFTAPHVGPTGHENFYRNHFKPAVRAAGLPEQHRFHDLRHTYAVFCFSATADNPYAVMNRWDTPRSRSATTPMDTCSRSERRRLRTA